MSQLQQNWRFAFKWVLGLVIVLWAVAVANFLLAYRLNNFGIYPREISGLWGIIFWPFLHGSFYHLILNTLPLSVMGFFVALRGRKVFLLSSLLIVVLSGTGVWLFGRAAYHVGASGLVFGYFGFLVMLAYYERSVRAFLIASVVVFLYGGMLWGIIPGSHIVSWEGHLFGLVAGVFSARFVIDKR